MERKSIYTSNRIQNIVLGLMNQVRMDAPNAALVDWHIIVAQGEAPKLYVTYRLDGVERDKEYPL
jgi:hypothetical protein